MIKNTVKLSKDFKAQTTKAISTIILFAFVYLFIVILAIGFTALCAFGGIMLVLSKPALITLALGVGLASLGVIVLIFLFKFIFKSYKTDRSHLLEITAQDEPALFRLIEEIVNQVGTDFPKKVYLSADVNAAVFYDSNFWSMLFPVKKNLQIGLGLVNTVTAEELRAILAHEFGHFSQRTMKVGSWVYNVNQVIHNMLFENESYDVMIQKWANVSGYFMFFVAIAVKIVQGIQWVLRKVYEEVNVSYMALSREMEFHADEIAAHVTGHLPLQHSLLRMSLADHAFNAVLNHYGSKIKENIKSENIYKEQAFVMDFLAQDSKLPYENGLPQVALEELNKYNKSKLVIKDQWASHPSVEDRIARLEQLDLSVENSATHSSNSLFKNILLSQKQLTDLLFKEVAYTGKVKHGSLEEFKAAYKAEMRNSSFDEVYHGYYDFKNPLAFDLGDTTGDAASIHPSELFSQEKLELVYNSIALQNDIQTLTQIASKEVSIKSFDYDGKRYKQGEAQELLLNLQAELERVDAQIKENDRNVFRYADRLEKALQQEQTLKGKYQAFFSFDKEFDEKAAVYGQLSEATQFINFITPFEEIQKNFQELRPIEHDLKDRIRELLTDDRFNTEVTDEIRESFDKYLSREWDYFGREAYFDQHLEILFSAMNNFYYVLSRGYFLLKKELLTYQAELLKGAEQHPASVLSIEEQDLDPLV